MCRLFDVKANELIHLCKGVVSPLTLHDKMLKFMYSSLFLGCHRGYHVNIVASIEILNSIWIKFVLIYQN